MKVSESLDAHPKGHPARHAAGLKLVWHDCHAAGTGKTHYGKVSDNAAAGGHLFTGPLIVEAGSQLEHGLGMRTDQSYHNWGICWGHCDQVLCGVLTSSGSFGLR